LRRSFTGASWSTFAGGPNCATAPGDADAAGARAAIAAVKSSAAAVLIPAQGKHVQRRECKRAKNRNSGNPVRNVPRRSYKPVMNPLEGRSSMSRYEESLPGELSEVAERLRDERAQASGLELDRIKTRAMAQASSSRPKGIVLRSRSIAALLTVALMAAGTGGVIAGTSSPSGGSASNSQYKPGCGPKKTDGVNPSGTHTGPPGQGDTARESCPQ
jgi:hypothetical protein